MDRRYDFLVIGSGIAGLSYALKVAEKDPQVKVAVVTKKGEAATSTNRAQGGIAAVMSGTDSFEAHIEDTLRAGSGLCHRDVVERVVEAGPSAIEKLVKVGVRFTSSEGKPDLGREGGHSHSRVVHALDLTGQEIERALIKACHQQSNISIFTDHMVLELLTYRQGGDRRCAGAFVFAERGRNFNIFYASVTMLATGGLGMVYFHTSNPKIATGDGLAIAYRAGASVANLEFIQFHPTTLYSPGRRPFLLSEALRGEGGRLRSVDRRYFMEGAHPLKELAPRDVVARAIDRELKNTGEEYVFLEVNHLEADFIKRRFPNIYTQCLKYGFDITQRPVPVVPAAHYACGGVVSTIDGETELAGLYVAGEVAMTGMHGANRLASNSLLEAVVVADLAVDKSYDYYANTDFPASVPIDNMPYSSLEYPRGKILIAHDRREITRVMSDFVGIMRTKDQLNVALDKVHKIRDAIDQYYMATPATYNTVELRSIATVAELIIKSAISRKESRGLHYVEEYPEMDDEFLKDTIIRGQLPEERT
ncbi:MAG: L-aspartate oxidase [Candidatus Zixiibacteriota bacterium]|nr:MAG: L-aspartate oxidase [candidate division Zixibacteria bacterium]